MATGAPSQPPGLARLGAACARHPLAVLGCWLVVLAGVLAGAHLGGGVFSDNVTLPGTEASTGLQLLRRHDPAASGFSALVVVRSRSTPLSAEAGPVDGAVADLSALPHVLSVANPLSPSSPAVSPNGLIAMIEVHLDVLPKTLGSAYLARVEAATAPLRHAGLEVEYGGTFDQLTRPKAVDGRSELIGFGVALVVLVVGFGSLLGAALPLFTALVSVVVGTSILGLVAAVLTFGTASPTLALMVGLGVGIDYAVFLTTRFRQRLLDGLPVDRAAGSTVATSGHAVLVAASTVSVALLGLYVSGVSFLGQLGLAAVFTVVTAGAGAVTLVPAGLGLLGRRIDRYHLRPPVAETGHEGDGWHRYAALIGRHPASSLCAGLVVLGVLAIPLFSIFLGHVDSGADPASFTDKRAYDLVTEGFGVGTNGPLTVVVRLATHSPSGAGSGSALGSQLQATLAATPDVARASTLSTTPDGALLVGSVIPKSSPQSAATTGLFHRLVDTTLPGALRGTGATGYVTGTVASNVQFADILASRLPLVIVAVVLVALLLVMATFRSVLLAVKAALLNLVSISAAYGVLVAVFQWGWGRSLLGLSENVPIESYVPMMMFAIVFGLSMDYEVFLLSRVKERFDRTGDPHGAVAAGLSATGRVITCAALIMISVFLSFVASTLVVIKMLAVGLAFSVLIDATIVRLLLVPAVMYLLGARAWWLPRWLDRVLPRLEAEGSDPGPPPGPTPSSGPGPSPDADPETAPPPVNVPA